MISADRVAEQLGEVLKLDVKAFAVPRAEWAEAFEQFGIPKGHTARSAATWLTAYCDLVPSGRRR